MQRDRRRATRCEDDNWETFLPRLDGCDLERENLRDRDDLTDLRLNRALLAGLRVRRSDLSRSQIIAADLTGAELREAKLQEVELRHSILVGVDGRGVDLTSSDLREADLTDANLDAALLLNVRWDSATCPDGTSANESDPPSCCGRLTWIDPGDEGKERMEQTAVATEGCPSE